MASTTKNRMKGVTGFLILVGFIMISWFFFNQDFKLGLFLLIGLGLGYVESHSEVGISSGFVDFFISGSRSRLYGLLLLFGLGTLAALYVHLQAASEGMVPEHLASSGQLTIPGTGAVTPVDFGLILGSFLFGVGLTLNEGCGLGTLRNIGLGQGRYLITFFFLLIGTIPGQLVKYFLDQSVLHNYSVDLYLPEAFGYRGTVVLGVILFTLLVVSAIRYEKRRREEGTYKDVDEVNLPNVEAEEKKYPVIYYLLRENWSRLISVLLITGLLLLALILTGEKLAVTQPFVYPAVALFQSFGVNFTSPAFNEPLEVVQKGLLNNHNVLQNMGIVFGALIFGLTSMQFSFSWDGKVKEFGWFSLSGFLMGFGAVLASGCIVGALYSGIVNLSLSGWVVFASMSLGIWLTVKMMNGKISTISEISK